MQQETKNTIRKWAIVLLTLLVLAASIWVLLYGFKWQKNKTIHAVKISITNPAAANFLNEGYVQCILQMQFGNEIANQSVDAETISKVEAFLNKNSWIQNAEAFIDVNNNLQIEVEQKIPFIRVFEQNGASYYLDRTLHPIPLSATYTPVLMVVANVPSATYTTKLNTFKSIAFIADFIQADTFWNAQTQMIVVRDTNDFAILTALGKQLIVLGDTSNLSNKLSNVFLFYKKLLKKIGWNLYTTIDARFDGQLVAKPKLSLPEIKDVNKNENIDWVKSIIGNQSINDSFPKQINAKTPIVVPQLTPNKNAEAIPKDKPPPRIVKQIKSQEVKSKIKKKEVPKKPQKPKKKQKNTTKPKYILK